MKSTAATGLGGDRAVLVAGSLMLAVIPVVAISPILLYIGMRICSQAFQTTPREHAAGTNSGAQHAPEFVGKAARNGVCCRTCGCGAGGVV